MVQKDKNSIENEEVHTFTIHHDTTSLLWQDRYGKAIGTG